MSRRWLLVSFTVAAVLVATTFSMTSRTAQASATDGERFFSGVLTLAAVGFCDEFQLNIQSLGQNYSSVYGVSAVPCGIDGLIFGGMAPTNIGGVIGGQLNFTVIVNNGNSTTVACVLDHRGTGNCRNSFGQQFPVIPKSGSGYKSGAVPLMVQ